jgi:hypothetical protein
MPIKLFAALIALVLMIGYLIPVVLKLKEISLGVIVAIGLGMMLVDLVQSLKSKEN